MNWYIEVLKKYTEFSGRARRKEYWYFVLFNLIVSFLFLGLDFMLGTFNSEAGYGVFNTIYSLAVLLPAIGVGIRRLHDIGRSGWFILIGLIPFIGFIILLVFFVKDSQPGENQYGTNPKGA